MSRPIKKLSIGLLAGTALLLVGIVGCSVDTPTAPEQVPAPPPTVGENNWNIAVSVDPDELVVGSTTPATVFVEVESRFDGSRPPNGTTMVLSTTIGEFTAPNSELRSIGVVLDRGRASAVLFAGSVVSSGTVTARLEGSTARSPFAVLAQPQTPFITALSPNSGSENGGTQATIQGVNFAEPLRVTFGVGGSEKLATVLSASDTAIQIITPSAPDMLFVECDAGGGNVGLRKVDTPADVAVTYLAIDGSERTGSLDGAFTYLSNSDACVD